MATLSVTGTLINLYIFTTISYFAYQCHQTYMHAQNYFSAALIILQDPLSKLLIYNFIIAVSTIFYRMNIFIFYEEVKENQTMTMMEKIGYKIFELFYFIYVVGIGFGLETFLCVTVVFMSFMFHNLAVIRAKFLIHTHVSENMNLNYRLLAHFLALLFFDYQIITNTFFWLFSSGPGEQSYILFAYYAVSIGMTIVEPAISFFIHFYQVYTNTPIKDSDLLLISFNFWINGGRLVIQIILSMWIAYRFTLSFLIIITLIESISELSKTYTNYMSIHKLTQKMKNLKKLGPEQLKDIHDRVCTICFSDMINSGVSLLCKHAFHEECLRQWIVKNSNHHCPKCKKPLNFDQNQDQDAFIFGVNNFLNQRGRLNNLQRERQNLMNLARREDPLGFRRDQQEKALEKKKKREKKKNENIESDTKLDRTEFAKKINEYYEEQNIQYERKYKSRNKMEEEEWEQQQSSFSGSQSVSDIEAIHVDGNYIASSPKKRQKKVVRVRADENSDKIGSVPYGLPTEAVYHRRKPDMKARKKLIEINEKMINFLKLQPTKQLLFVPEL